MDLEKMNVVKQDFKNFPALAFIAFGLATEALSKKTGKPNTYWQYILITEAQQIFEDLTEPQLIAWLKKHIPEYCEINV